MANKNDDSLFRHPFMPIFCLIIVAVKCLLIRCYYSTDFEVHRNWMALVHHLPMSDWYRSDLSQWTLDYPPFFAYLEWIFAQFAAALDPEIVTLQRDAFFSQNTLIFQRITVIIADLCYFFSCVLLADNFVSSPWLPAKLFRHRLKLALCVFLATNPALILLDNVHFQYNAFLFGIFLFSLNAMFTNQLLMGAFLFAVLLNFKHIFLYYSPAFVAFYLFRFLFPMGRQFLRRFFSLASVVGVVSIASFGPFFLIDGFSALRHIVARLFPFKRGLTHACWAPNFWALYNFADLFAHKIVAKIVSSTNCSAWHWLLKRCPPGMPEYTRGLVQEYEHAVLPNISPPVTFALILCKFGKPSDECLLISLTFSAFAFFCFGWHVHEKAILLVFFPLCLLAIKDPTFMQPFALLYVASIFAQFPLFFTPFECFLKWAFTLWHFALCQFLANFVWGIRLAEFTQFTVAKLALFQMVLAQFYADFCHRLIFGSNFAFLPMMVPSVASAAAAAQSGNLLLGMDKVKFVAGVDVSQCKSQPQFAVVSLVVQTFPGLKVLYVADEVVLLGQPAHYITEYLAVREAGPIRRAICRHLKHCPKIQLLFVDGNGKWHSRGCGLACHVGYNLNVSTVGMAKNFAPAPLLKLGQLPVELVASKNADSENYRKWFKSTQSNALKLAEDQCKTVNGSAMFVMQNADQQLHDLAILRSSTSHVPLFVSSGWAIEFDLAAKIALECIDQNPIRLSDLRSRTKLHELFER
ncbi:hypothetical protein niasHT_016257 [Heterodera trifolii]|uniref:Alpha-1,3-glucosyltransferase n=1 Tax=Heterodera trifolii TaxID=157864 RepID=A0ABD2LLG5_9BILA